MRVTFRRIGLRRYEILVDRELAPQLISHPGIGWDEYLPHDLLHFVAEAEWGIDDGVFGQLAAGGDAATFVPTQRVESKWRRRSERLMKTSTGMGRSERLGAALQIAWCRRHGHPDPPQKPETYALVAEAERLLDRLDELAERWHALKIGESLVLEWPRPEGRRAHPAARRKRRDRHSRLHSY